ncbi:hypothetical protein C6502_20615 [Candidatus Poribacteria bacterium]|nr:MAG: hypothetical protein C6502_20615 [Candidatus Poribacteria bacterium]
MPPLVYTSEHFAHLRVKKPTNLHGAGQSFNLRAGKPATIMGVKMEVVREVANDQGYSLYFLQMFGTEIDA